MDSYYTLRERERISIVMEKLEEELSCREGENGHAYLYVDRKAVCVIPGVAVFMEGRSDCGGSKSHFQSSTTSGC